MLLEEPRSPDRLRRRAARALRALSTVLMVSGSLLILDAGLTLVWQEPISAVYGRWQQRSLADQLGGAQSLSALQLRALERLRSERRRMAFLARALRRDAEPGQALGRIRIPRTGTDFVVVEGTQPGDLRKGPGRYADTSMPGLPGTVAIAGHRTTYLAPFRQLDRLRAGDTIVVQMPYGRFTYRLQSRHIVEPSAYRFVTAGRGYERLALTACHPLYSARQRIVVFARLAGVQALGRARVPAAL